MELLWLLGEHRAVVLLAGYRHKGQAWWALGWMQDHPDSGQPQDIQDEFLAVVQYLWYDRNQKSWSRLVTQWNEYLHYLGKYIIHCVTHCSFQWHYYQWIWDGEMGKMEAWSSVCVLERDETRGVMVMTDVTERRSWTCCHCQVGLVGWCAAAWSLLRLSPQTCCPATRSL